MTQEAFQSGCERPGAAVPNYYKLGEFREQFIFSEHKGIWRPEFEICSIGHELRVGRLMFSLKFLWQNPVSPLPTSGGSWQFLLDGCTAPVSASRAISSPFSSGCVQIFRSLTHKETPDCI